MVKLLVIIGCGIAFIFALLSLVLADEQLTITTYYPSPYGSYNQLQTNSLGIGDNDNDGSLDSGDVPNPATDPGGVWIKGSVGIGTIAPAAKLEVQGGAIKATGGLIIETRSGSDPGAPVDGQMWLRPDCPGGAGC